MNTLNITNVNVTTIADHPAVEFDIEQNGVKTKGFEWLNKHDDYWIVERIDSNIKINGLECDQHVEDDQIEYDSCDIFDELDNQLQDLI